MKSHIDYIKQKMLAHADHDIVIASYDNGADVCLECEDCWEVIFSTETLEELLNYFKEK